MKRLTKVIVFTISLLGWGMTAQAQEEGLKIAVLDMNAALFNTEQAKAVDEEMQTETAEDEQKVRDLATQAQNLQQRLQQDGAVMSDAERKRVNDQIQEIGVQYQFLVQKLQETLQQRRQQFQQAYAPNLIQAIQEVVEEDGYDIVLRAEVALYFNTPFDITARVTEKLNQQQQQ